MKHIQMLKGFLVFVAAALMLVTMLPGAGITPGWAQDKIIKIDGSSTVYPISEAVAEEFQKAKRGTVKVTVGISGTNTRRI